MAKAILDAIEQLEIYTAANKQKGGICIYGKYYCQKRRG